MHPILLRLRLGAIILTALGTLTAARADDWPQWLGPQRDGVWRETGIMEKFPAGGPPIRWRTPIGAGYAGPAVAAGRVFVTDRLLAPGARLDPNPFKRSLAEGTERVLCLSEQNGDILWKHEYPCTYEISYASGPRTTPVVHAGKVYTLGAMGHLYCLEAATGRVVWSKNLPKDYEAPPQTWGFSAHPLIDGDKLICLVGGPGSTVVAFHKDTGKELWRSLSATEQGYCPPMIYSFGGQRHLVIWHPEAVNGLDPETGRLLWSVPFRVRAGLTIATPRQEGDRLFVSSFYNGSLMLRIDARKPAAEIVWKIAGRSEQPRQTEGLHSLMVTPVWKDGHLYGVCSYGQLRCLKAETGERLWSSLAATGGKEERWATAFLVAQGDRYVLFNERGDLIFARLTPKGYEEIDKAHVLEPTNFMAAGQRQGGAVLWSHPAFANRTMYARNDREIIAVSLAAEAGR
ncbi:MAG: PQQ-binding-like beta-propeller repeat protein [Gemmataceae bacterium]|nr:PQQ-binding-like beta-propeller repeat protein [Gemmataceae bacterium]MDW8265653.1 PQQ-binding-like beta-propeller repeat protein [Gemmataceae bacterium]